MKEISVPALLEKLDDVTAFVNGGLAEHKCPMRVQLQADIAVEELFVNIAHYAYYPEIGKPYNPLEKDDPDISLSAEMTERERGRRTWQNVR